jgi:AbrB family looped-hinge helix DNA binding protein
MATNIIKVQKKGQVVIPRELRESMGVFEGDLLQIRIKGGEFILTPQVAINREILNAPDRERRRLLAELAKTVGGLRQEAERRGVDRLTAREINSAIEKARKNRREPVNSARQ